MIEDQQRTQAGATEATAEVVGSSTPSPGTAETRRISGVGSAEQPGDASGTEQQNHHR